MIPSTTPNGASGSSVATTAGDQPKVRGGIVGAGAAACAVCCAAPLMTLLGIGLTGAAATAFTLAFAGIVFAIVVAVATIAAVVHRRRRAVRNACVSPGSDASGAPGAVPVELIGVRPAEPVERS